MTAGAENYCKKCGHIGAYFVPTPDSVHNGKLVCASCGAFIKHGGNKKLTEMYRWVYVDDDGDWCFNFGKYSGRKILIVMDENPGYFRWIVDKTDFDEKCPEFLDLLSELAEQNGLMLGIE